LDVVTALVRDFSLEDHGPESAVGLLVEDLAVATGIHIALPPRVGLPLQGAALLRFLLKSGLVREAPEA
jgi:hypothetical protein